MPIITITSAAPLSGPLQGAAALLRDGGLVAFPTETVYGLGANAFDAGAVARVFAAKGRPADNPLIVHLTDAGALDRVAVEVSPLARELAARWWPGPLTLVVTAHPDLPSATRGGLATVAVRVPDHPVARALIGAAGVPVAAPSANRSGRPSPTTAAHVAHDLGERVDLIVDGGPCRVGVESTVVDARGDVPLVLREGSVTREDLGAVAADGSPASPGTRHRHYQPSCRVRLALPGAAAATALEEARTGARVGLVTAGPAPEGVRSLGRYRDADDLAARLYDMLRTAEQSEIDVLVVEGVAEVGIGRAVMDRLRRAAAPN
jgi:L-threonylcarbamoyladenylate synthase